MGYRLRIVAGPGLGSEIDVDSSELTIGRAPENSIVINDNNVSRVHAKVTMAAGNRVVVADNGSRNGVFVNDRKVAQQPLNPGDRVVIGQTVLELVSDARAPDVRTARPPPRPAGRPAPGGPPLATTGQVSMRAPAGRPGAPAGRGAMVRPSNKVAAQRPGASVRKPATGAKKPGRGIPKPFLFLGVGAVVVIFAVIGVISSGFGTKTPVGPVVPDATPRPDITPPVFTIGGGADRRGNDSKLSKKGQQWIDVGDSNRVSQNLPKARDAYRQAVKLEPDCLSCKVRLDAVEREIAERVSIYTKSGQRNFENGDYRAAAESWKIAVEFIDDPKSGPSRTLQSQIASAESKIQTQPQ